MQDPSITELKRNVNHTFPLKILLGPSTVPRNIVLVMFCSTIVTHVLFVTKSEEVDLSKNSKRIKSTLLITYCSIFAELFDHLIRTLAKLERLDVLVVGY